MKTNEKGQNLREIVSFYFKAKGEVKNETLQKWINEIKKFDEEEVAGSKWATKIKDGSWATNKYGKKLYYRLG